MTEWNEEVRARLERLAEGKPVLGVYLLKEDAADLRAALGEIERLKNELLLVIAPPRRRRPARGPR
jgi:hypothetical protein